MGSQSAFEFFLGFRIWPHWELRFLTQLCLDLVMDVNILILKIDSFFIHLMQYWTFINMEHGSLQFFKMFKSCKSQNCYQLKYHTYQIHFNLSFDGGLKLYFLMKGRGWFYAPFFTYENNRKRDVLYFFLHGKIKPIFLTYRGVHGLGVP